MAAPSLAALLPYGCGVPLAGASAPGGPLGTAAPTDEVRHIRPYESDVTCRFSNTLRNIKIEFNDTD